jgi:hypothetical protein
MPKEPLPIFPAPAAPTGPAFPPPAADARTEPDEPELEGYKSELLDAILDP